MKNMYGFLLSVLIGSTGMAQFKMVKLCATMVNAKKETPKVLRVNFLNPFQPNAKSAAFDERQQLCLEQEMLFTQNITVQYNGTFINLYVSPGDSIHLTIDASLLGSPDFEWVRFSGDHAVLTKQLNNWHHFASKIPYKKYDYDLPPQQMLTAVEMDYDRYLAELKKYNEVNPLAPEILDWAKADIKYMISNWISDYTLSKSITETQRKERIDFFAGSFFEIANPANFKSMMFPYHLSIHAYNLTRYNSNIIDLTTAGRGKDALQASLDILMQQTPGMGRDYMLFYLLSKQLRSNPALVDSIGGLQRYFTNELAYRYLQAFAKSIAEPFFPETKIDAVVSVNGKEKALPAGDLIAYLSKKYPNKIIYIDVYATWCAPCMEENKIARTMEDRFRKEEIVQVSLCLQSDPGKWRALLQKEKTKGEHLFLGEDATKIFMGVYGVNGFPTYFIVNKTGKIVTNAAPRPSDGDVLFQAFGKVKGL